ncbi:MAG: sensor histidine kinase, partial [Alphaproteobacteria bacterium]|nr:sensor histidine kinase [Alphaproteobacteria bacterium]
QTAGLSDIHSDELLSTILRQITNMTDRPDRKLNVQTEFADIHMTPDQAVPLALLVAEAVTNAIKYAVAPPGETAQLHVSLTRQSEKRAELCLRNTVTGVEPPAPGEDLEEGNPEDRTGLGTQLITAFALQLGGTAEQSHAQGWHELRVGFDVRPLVDAEERRASANEPSGATDGEPGG